MSLKRILALRWPRFVGTAAAGTLLLGIGAVCSKYPTIKDLPIDCTPENGYELYSKATDNNPSRDLTLDGFAADNWYGSPDYTPDGGATSSSGDNAGAPLDANRYLASASKPTANAIPDGGFCGYTTAGVFRASHNNAWGGLFGNWSFGSTPQDAHDWEGIALWARAPGETSKGFILSLNDNNTTAPTRDTENPQDPAKNVPSFCTSYSTDAGVGSAGQGSTQVTYDPGTGTPITGGGITRAPYPNECGNGYTTTITVTSDWQFYTVPFAAFQQAANPNRVPNSVFDAGIVSGTGLLTSALRYFGIRMPKESEVELWIARMAFYRKKPQ